MNDNRSAAEIAETDVKAACDLICERAIVMMEECGAPAYLLLGRMLNAAARSVALELGGDAAAQAFRQMADSIQAGLFHKHATRSQVKH